MGPKSGQKHTVRRRRNAAARRNSYWLSLCCCALALKPAVAAEIASAQQTPSQEASPGPHGVDRLEQTSSQCDAELALAQHAVN